LTQPTAGDGGTAWLVVALPAVAAALALVLVSTPQTPKVASEGSDACVLKEALQQASKELFSPAASVGRKQWESGPGACGGSHELQLVCVPPTGSAAASGELAAIHAGRRLRRHPAGLGTRCRQGQQQDESPKHHAARGDVKSSMKQLRGVACEGKLRWRPKSVSWVCELAAALSISMRQGGKGGAFSAAVSCHTGL
jgi:hypothetical protein